jgi:hypothetical protein
LLLKSNLLAQSGTVVRVSGLTDHIGTRSTLLYKGGPVC